MKNKNEFTDDLMEANRLVVFLFILGIGFTIGAMFILFLISFNIGDFLGNNGLMYKKDCKPFVVQNSIYQPKLICSNENGGVDYYCNYAIDWSNRTIYNEKGEVVGHT